MSANEPTPNGRQKSARLFSRPFLLRLLVVFLLEALFAGLLLWGCIHYIQPHIGNKILWTESTTQELSDSGIVLANGDVLSQEFYHGGVLNSVMFGLHYSRVVPQEGACYEVTLYDAVTGGQLDSLTCPIPAGYEAVEHGFIFSGSHRATDGLYRVEIVPQGFPEDVQITLSHLAEPSRSLCPSNTMLGGQDTGFVSMLSSGTNFVHVRTVYFLFCAILLLVVFALSLLFLFGRCSLLTKFVLTALALGLLFCLIFPPFASYDEDAHFGTAYYYAQKLLYPKQTQELSAYATDRLNHSEFVLYELPCRTEDERESLYPIYYRANRFYKYYAQFDLSFGHANDMDGTLTISLFSDDLGLSYSPAVLGILLGRLLGASRDLLPLLARLFTYLAYVALCALGIRTAPKGKSLLVCCALLPSALLITCSAANDLLHCGTGILLAGLALYFSEKDRPIRGIHLAGLLFCAAIIFVSSQLQLLPLLLWAGWLLLRRRFTLRPTRRFWLFAALAVAAGLLLWFAAVRTGLITTPADTNAEQQMGLFYVLCHPLNAVSMMVSSAVQNAEKYYIQWLGSLLGWGNMNIGDFATVLLTVLLVAAGFAAAAELRLPAGDRIVAHICGLAVIALSFCVGFQWTSAAYFAANDSLWGIQGRYFLSALPPLLLVLPPVKRLAPKMPSAEWFCFAFCLADCFVLARSLMITIGR